MHWRNKATVHWDLAFPGLICLPKGNGNADFHKEKGLCTPGLDQRLSVSYSLPTTPHLLALQAPHLPKLSRFEPAIKTQLMLSGYDPQTLPGISMNSMGHFHSLGPSTFISAKSNAMPRNKIISPDHSDFPKVILTLFTLWCCVSHHGEDKPSSGQTSIYLPTEDSREG